MNLAAALADPAAYPHAPDRVEPVQTHISLVFLAGEFVYKLKKPVSLGFLDFSTVERRKHFCEEEVRLNRRLAPHVYLGVVPVTADGGRVRVEGPGEPIDWAVKMVRLPPGASLLERVERGEATTDDMARIARFLADFHAGAEGGPKVAAFGRFETVAGNARENFAQAEAHVGRTLSRPVFDRLRSLTDAALDRLRPVIESRAARGVPRDTHGDLHLDHVYLCHGNPPPEDLFAIDCIEFNDRFRYADPVADLAFLVMDLKFRRRPDLAAALADEYFRASGDAEGRGLLPFYTAYRAAVRGKVEGFELDEPEVPADEKAAALARAKAHWLLALGELEEPARRPALVLVGGLPGTGKSTLARGLGGFTWVRSDAVRKELAGLPPTTPGGPELYTAGMTDRTYAECRQRAADALFRGERVVVDATFREDARRRDLLELAAGLGVPAVLAVCEADAAVVRDRLAARTGDASDADWGVYEKAAAVWEPPGPAVAPHVVRVRTDAPGAAETVAAAVRATQRSGM